MPKIPEDQIYAAIGDAGFERLVQAFYAQVPGDSILGPMYAASDQSQAETRLRDFLIMRFGGPSTYAESRGHPRLRMRHLPFAIDVSAKDRWMVLMLRAIESADISDDVAIVLRTYFTDAATFLVNR